MRTFGRLALSLWLGLFAFPGEAETPAQKATADYVAAQEKTLFGEFLELLRLPNHSSNQADIRANAAAIRALYESEGFAVTLLEAEGGPPSLLAELETPGAEETLVMYLHFDGQPVDPSRWATPPFSPTIRAGRLEDGADIVSLGDIEGPVPRDWRVYARSAGDDKGPVIAILYAVKALKAAGIPLSVNLKVFMEGAEEEGSPNLAAIVEKYRDKLASDFWIFADGPQDQRGNPRVVLGVRGSFGFQLTVYGPARGLHSGHYGNFSPNPSLLLAHLIASMRSPAGEVLIDGFYGEVREPGEAERALIAAIPDADALIMEDAGIAAREYPELRYEEALLQPALNVQSLYSGAPGGGSINMIDSRAIAAIGIRAVPDMTIPRTKEVIERHIEAQGYHIVREEPDLATRLAHPRIAKVVWGEGGYPAVRTTPDNAYVQRLITIMQEATGGETLVYPTLGGSLPLAHVVEPLNVPFAIVPIANQDNSQHAPNENIRIGHLLKGVEYFAAILAEIGREKD